MFQRSSMRKIFLHYYRLCVEKACSDTQSRFASLVESMRITQSVSVICSPQKLTDHFASRRCLRANKLIKIRNPQIVRKCWASYR